jgi:hypothetical protein
MSPDDQLLATGGSKQPIHFWETRTGKERFSLQQLQEDVVSIDFSPDGKVLASGDAAGVVYLWEVSTGQVRLKLQGHRGTINALAFAPDGKTLATGSSDSSAVIWDLTNPIHRKPLATGRRSSAELDALWTDLACGDAGKADDAMRELIAAPMDALHLLKARLRPIPVTASQGITELLQQLESDSFVVRQRATRDLERMQDLAEPALHKILAARPSTEVRRRADQILRSWGGRITSAELLRAVRAIEVLEHVDTAEARQLLTLLGGGLAEARLTQEAKASLDRLAKRSARK